MARLTLHNLQVAKGAKRGKRRVGRGNASGKGNYSGRGNKGQRARSGGKNKLAMRGIRGYLLRIPKKRGFKSIAVKAEVVNLDTLEAIAKNGEVITPKYLLQKGLIKSVKNGVKILGQGKLTKKLTVNVSQFSRTAKDAILKAGGNIEVFKSMVRVKKTVNHKSKKA